MNSWNQLPLDLKREILALSVSRASIRISVACARVLSTISKEIARIFKQWRTWKRIFERLGFTTADKVDIPEGGFDPVSSLFKVRETTDYKFTAWRQYKITKTKIDDNSIVSQGSVYRTPNYLLLIHKGDACIYYRTIDHCWYFNIKYDLWNALYIMETLIGLMMIFENNNNGNRKLLIWDGNKFINFADISSNDVITYHGLYKGNAFQPWQRTGNFLSMKAFICFNLHLPSNNITVQRMGSTQFDIVYPSDENSGMFVVYDFKLMKTIWVGYSNDYELMYSLDKVLVVDGNICDAFTGVILYKVGKIHQITLRSDMSGFDIWPYKIEHGMDIESDEE